MTGCKSGFPYPVGPVQSTSPWCFSARSMNGCGAKILPSCKLSGRIPSVKSVFRLPCKYWFWFLIDLQVPLMYQGRLYGRIVRAYPCLQFPIRRLSSGPRIFSRILISEFTRMATANLLPNECQKILLDRKIHNWRARLMGWLSLSWMITHQYCNFLHRKLLWAVLKLVHCICFYKYAIILRWFRLPRDFLVWWLLEWLGLPAEFRKSTRPDVPLHRVHKVFCFAFLLFICC